MQTKAAIWSGDTSETPKPLPKHNCLVACVTDSWCVLLTDTSCLLLTFPSKLKVLKIPDRVTFASCTSTTCLLLTASGDVWGFCTSPTCALLFNSSAKPTHAFKISGLSNIIHVSIGETHAAAICKFGQVLTWSDPKQSTISELPGTEILTPIQVLCGSNFTIVLTSAGFLYVFGRLSQSKRCNPVPPPKCCPYILKTLDNYFVSEICKGDFFIAALTPSAVFLFDSCLQPVKFTTENLEITKIAASATSVIAASRDRLYIWKEAEGIEKCALKHWVGRVVALSQGFRGCRITGGAQRNFGLVSEGKGSIGEEVEGEENRPVDDQIDELEPTDEAHEEKKEAIQRIIRVVKESIRRVIWRFGKLGGEGRNDKREVLSFIAKLRKVAFRTVLEYARALVAGKSEVRSEKIKKFAQIVYIYQIKIYFTRVVSKCRVAPRIQLTKVKCASAILKSTARKLFQKLKSSVFIALARNISLDTKSNSFVKKIKRLYKPKFSQCMTQITSYSSQIKKNSITQLIYYLLRNQEKAKCINLARFFLMFKAVTSGRCSIESKSSAMLNPKSGIKHSITGLDEPLRSYETFSRPNKFLRPDRSPKPNLLASNKLLHAKSKRRPASKPPSMEKSKLNSKPRPQKKGIQFAEEIKSRQVKNKFLKITIGSSSKNNEEASESPLNYFSFLPKFSNLCRIFNDKVKKLYFEAFSAIDVWSKLKQTAPLNTQSIFPEHASETWKLKMYSLGLNKFTLFCKKHLLTNTFSHYH